MEQFPHSKPSVGVDEALELLDEVSKGAIGSGECTKEFEERMRAYTKREYSKCTSSGTTAIQLALRAQSIGIGDEVIIPSYVCYSVMSAVDAVGARPVFADIGKNSPNITRKSIESKMTGMTKNVIVPHMFGHRADIDKIQELGLPVIEDCAQAIGGSTIGSKGDVSILSFYATKILACARGGMVLTDDKNVYDRLDDLMQYDGRESAGECYNFSMTNLEAAIGLVQLEKLNGFIRKRNQIGKIYDNILKNQGLEETILRRPKGSIVGRYVLRLPEHKNLDEVIGKMKKEGIDCRKPVFRPLHTYLNSGNYPNTMNAYSRNISLPVYPGLEESHADYIGKKLVKIIKNS